MDGGVVQYLGDTISGLYDRTVILSVNSCGHVDMEDVLIASS
jgi:hypothetical protein